MSDLTYVVGDTAPSIFGTLTDTATGQPYDLTSAAVRFQMRLAIDRRFSVDAPATIVNAATGSVRYDWADDDLLEAGAFVSRWLIIFTDNSDEHTLPANTITVEPA